MALRSQLRSEEQGPYGNTTANATLAMLACVVYEDSVDLEFANVTAVADGFGLPTLVQLRSDMIQAIGEKWRADYAPGLTLYALNISRNYLPGDLQHDQVVLDWLARPELERQVLGLKLLAEPGCPLFDLAFDEINEATITALLAGVDGEVEACGMRLLGDCLNARYIHLAPAPRPAAGAGDVASIARAVLQVQSSSQSEKDKARFADEAAIRAALSVLAAGADRQVLLFGTGLTHPRAERGGARGAVGDRPGGA